MKVGPTPHWPWTAPTIRCSEHSSGSGGVRPDRPSAGDARHGRARTRSSDPIRELRVRTETGKMLRIVTNASGMPPADQIAELLQAPAGRLCELFFRWVKHSLKIRHFFGYIRSNAVRMQIAIALIAFLLLRMAHAAAERRAKPAHLHEARIAYRIVMQRRCGSSTCSIHRQNASTSQNRRQLNLQLCQT